MCLEPPLRIDELPDEDAWFCKKCRDDIVSVSSLSTLLNLLTRLKANEGGAVQAVAPSPSPLTTTSNRPGASTGQPTKLVLGPIPQTFRLLVKKIDGENPTQFRLPTDVRTYFAGVSQDSAENYIEEANTRKPE